MLLYFDLDFGQLVTSPGTREPLRALEFKRGDTCTVTVQFLRGSIPQELATGATGSFGLKPVGDYDGNFAAAATAWTKAGTGTATLYHFALNLATTELNDLLGVGAGADVASVLLNAELEFIADSVRTSSQTLAATVHNDVVRGDEAGPTDVTPGTPAVAYATVTGTLTSDGTTAATFPDMDFAGPLAGFPNFFAGSVTHQCSNSGTYWELAGPAASWTSTSAASRPDLIPTGAWHATTNPDAWKPTSPATGTPVVAITNPTPGGAGSQKVDAAHLYVVASVTAGIPLWRKLAHSAL